MSSDQNQQPAIGTTEQLKKIDDQGSEIKEQQQSSRSESKAKHEIKKPQRTERSSNRGSYF